MIKIDMIGERMYALPRDRNARSIDGGESFDRQAVSLRHLVAVQAFFNGRDPGLTRSLRAGMAVETRDPESARVKLMRIGDWLRWLIASHKPIGLCIPSNAQNRGQDSHETDRQDEFRVVQKILPRLTPEAHLEIFPKQKWTSPSCCTDSQLIWAYLLSGDN
jgi:hypothetical protein